MIFSTETNPDFSSIEFPPEVEEVITKVSKFVSGYKPRDLELLASVHYWAKKELFFTDKYTPEYVYEKLLELKPDAGFTKNDVEKAIATLEFNSYLTKKN